MEKLQCETRVHKNATNTLKEYSTIFNEKKTDMAEDIKQRMKTLFLVFSSDGGKSRCSSGGCGSRYGWATVSRQLVQRSTEGIQAHHHLPHVFVVIKISSNEGVLVRYTRGPHKIQEATNVADLFKHSVAGRNVGYASTHANGSTAEHNAAFKLSMQSHFRIGSDRHSR
jgi:hypothetical protein